MTAPLVTLDLDHTLWNPDLALQNAETDSYHWLASAAPAFAAQFPLADFVAWRMALREQQPALRHRVSEMRRQAFVTALEHSGHPALVARELAEAAFQVFWQKRQHVDVFADTPALLAQLAGHYTLGALSNGNASLEAIGLAPFFAFHFAAENFPAAKPAPDLFRAALAHTGTAAAEAVHIGDHPIDDIQGAQGVGMKTVWVNLDDRSWPEKLSPPDATVTSLRDIPAALQALQVPLR